MTTTGVKQGDINGFFTAERQQRLELIRHLIVNGQKRILLKGEKQVGKKYFIHQFAKQLEPAWIFSKFDSTDIKVDGGFISLIEAGFNRHENSQRKLTQRLTSWSKADRTVILCIESVNRLDVSDIGELFEMVQKYSCLHLLLTQTEGLNEAFEKQCQTIDLEELSEQQTYEYAVLKAQESTQYAVSLAHVNAAELFEETGGVPGKVKQFLKDAQDEPLAELDKSKKPWLRSLKWLAVLIAIVMLGYKGYSLISNNVGAPKAVYKQPQQKAEKAIVPTLRKMELPAFDDT
ncbi:MAG: hypothetical protein KUG64_00400, partial [Cycloclasticus sp.]|nr:hypothetical protein [Cycloclasticus sp.]